MMLMSCAGLMPLHGLSSLNPKRETCRCDDVVDREKRGAFPSGLPFVFLNNSSHTCLAVDASPHSWTILRLDMSGLCKRLGLGRTEFPRMAGGEEFSRLSNVIQVLLISST